MGTKEFTVLDALTMLRGDVLTVNGHRVERVATGWYVDKRFTWSANVAAALVRESEPCEALPARQADFEYADFTGA